MPVSPSDSGNKVEVFKSNTIPASFVEEDISKELAVNKNECLTFTVPTITKTAHFKSPLQQMSSIGELLLLSDYFTFLCMHSGISSHLKYIFLQSFDVDSSDEKENACLYFNVVW